MTISLSKVVHKLRVLFPLLLRRPKGYGDFLLSSFAWLLRRRRVWGRPIYLTIEVTNVCNLRCPLCETGTGELQRTKRFMDMGRFRQVVDQIAPFANTVMLYFMGETFLNRQVYEMISYLKRARIFVTACTNGDMLDPAALVRSGMDEIVFQIGGVTQESHARYRHNSRLDKILEHIAEIVRLRETFNSSTPVVKMGFIIMRHNETEVPDFFALAKRLRVDHAEVVNTGVRTYEQALEYLPQDQRYWNYSPEALEKGKLLPRVQLRNECPWLYYSAVITVEGDVVPCCRDPHAHYIMGNVFQKPFLNIWNNERYRRFRNTILTRQRDCSLCALCWGFGVPLPNVDARKV